MGWSFHGDVKVFDYLLSLDIPWDFVQIQLNYVDWKNASGWNVNAEYLYGELEKRNIPVVIMEPLLGGRLSRLNALSLAKLKQMRPDDSPASWAFRYAGSPKGVLTVLSGMVYMEHLQENIRTFSPLEPITEQENKAFGRGDGEDATFGFRTLYGMSVLYALSVWLGYSGNVRSL